MKRYSIFIKGPAEKEMDALPRGVFFRVQKSILGLEINPRPRACKKLCGVTAYRIRVGNYRILYTVDDVARRVDILSVAHRKDVYRR